MKKKLQNLLEELNHGLVERQEAVKLSLLAALANEHMLLVGPPGTGKSMIARRISECFNNSGAGTENDYFEYLLTKFSTPEEIFGPLSISELKADRFKRNTAGYLPTVKVAFLDEIFKASSSILNALLTILNERIYHNGTERQKVPLQSLIAASNELPVGQDELNALYDRFLVRCFVDYVSTDSLPRFFETDTGEALAAYINEDELDSIRSAACSVNIPKVIQEAIQSIWMRHKEVFSEDRREQLSDRRLKKVIQLLRFAATTNGRTAVDLSDLVLLKHCLWNSQDNAEKVQNLVMKVLIQYSTGIFNGLNTEVGDLADFAAAPVQNGVTGYSGSGTPDDPLLVGNISQLLGLAKPEIGMRGYNFRQISDIDCSSVKIWKGADFLGCYDGFGYLIHRSSEDFEHNWSRDTIFGNVGEKSAIHGVHLKNFSLVRKAKGANVRYCHTNGHLIQHYADDCHVESCLAYIHIVGFGATGCTLSKCIAFSYLIGSGHRQPGNAISCKISDCAVYHDDPRHADEDFNIGGYGPGSGGLLHSAALNSVIERCYVSGTIFVSLNGSNLPGIAHECDASQITNCAVGHLRINDPSGRVNPGIANAINGGLLLNNATNWLLLLLGEGNDPDGPNGQYLFFNREFFEETLGWDFDNTWEWSEDTRGPMINLYKSHGKLGSKDMLTQQMISNIWL